MNWFNNLKIKHKMLCSFIIVAFIGAVVGAAGFIGLNKVGAALEEITHVHMAAIDSLTDLFKGQLYVAVGARGLINPNFSSAQRDATYSKIDDGLKIADEAMAVYSSLPKEDVQASLYQTFRVEWFEWFDSLEETLSLFQQYDRLLDEGHSKEDPEMAVAFDQCIDHYMKSTAPLMVKEEATLDKMIENNEHMVKAASEEAEKNQQYSILVLLVTVGSSFAFAVLLGILISNIISKPIMQLAQVAKHQTATGDTNVSVNITSTDEIGELANAFGMMLQVTKDQIRALETLATGDLEVDVVPRSDQDLLAISLNNMIKGNKEQQVVAERIAGGDLTAQIVPRSEKDSLSLAIKNMVDNLGSIVAQVQEATDQVAAASEQIGTGSQAIAQGAAEQASSLEEVSSSLEELTSMTRTNSENAMEAQSLAQDANNNAATGRATMEQMNIAIDEIKSASDETARIIKTIDDIAFQTNLLALNAAVEAARAGEAGRGFAVVAEEVRNLALRSAEAAKETSAMIEDSVKRADNGVQIAEEVHKSLLEITEGTEKVSELIAEIAAASQEQSNGIDQVTIATSQINKATQESAASAEEAASSSEELASQVMELRQTMGWFKVNVETNAGQKKAEIGQNGSTDPEKAKAPATKHSIPLDDDFTGF